jgi:hypothetical protein
MGSECTPKSVSRAKACVALWAGGRPGLAGPEGPEAEVQKALRRLFHMEVIIGSAEIPVSGRYCRVWSKCGGQMDKAGWDWALVRTVWGPGARGRQPGLARQGRLRRVSVGLRAFPQDCRGLLLPPTSRAMGVLRALGAGERRPAAEHGRQGDRGDTRPGATCCRRTERTEDATPQARPRLGPARGRPSTSDTLRGGPALRSCLRNAQPTAPASLRRLGTTRRRRCSSGFRERRRGPAREEEQANMAARRAGPGSRA